MQSKSKCILENANRKINYILHMSDEGAQKAALANLRRGIGRQLGEMPELWSFVMEKVDDELIEDVRFETAFFYALTLFAFHQQGHDPVTDQMHERGSNFGVAAAKFVFADKSGDIEQAKKRIIEKIGLITSSYDTEELYNRLRSMISLFKSNDIALDYADLTYALYRSFDRDAISKTYLGWGQAFYKAINKNNFDNTEEETDEEQ